MYSDLTQPITFLSCSFSPLDVEKEGKSRAWSARFSSPPFLRLFSPSHRLPCSLPCVPASFYFVQPSQLSQPPFEFKDKFKAR